MGKLSRGNIPPPYSAVEGGMEGFMVNPTVNLVVQGEL
jgi:hypothetical protein